MFRLNRSRALGIFCIVLFIYFVVFTDSGSSGPSEFRANTEAALSQRKQRNHDLPLRGDLSDADLTKKTNDELQGILSSQSKEGVRKDESGNSLGREQREPDHRLPSQAEMERVGMSREEPARRKKASENDAKLAHEIEDIGAAGRRAVEKPKYPKPDDREKALKGDNEDTETETGGDPGKDFAREKLMEYLKNPVVIFSKSYCPHSRRAKELLLNVYSIVPKPLVVELDMLGEAVPPSSSSDDDDHKKVTLGRALQDLLAEITSRKTVPNIVVGGVHSIGGNDNIWEMHESGILAEEIKKFGGRKVVSVDVNDTEDNEKR